MMTKTCCAKLRRPPNGTGRLALLKGNCWLEASWMPGKRVQFDEETWRALDLLARDSMKTFQELADEAFRDLLQKHGRPTDLKAALRRSAGEAWKEKASRQRKSRKT